MSDLGIVLNLPRSHCIIVFSLFYIFCLNVSSINASISEVDRDIIDLGVQGIDTYEYDIEVTDIRFAKHDERDLDFTDPGTASMPKFLISTVR